MFCEDCSISSLELDDDSFLADVIKRGHRDCLSYAGKIGYLISQRLISGAIFHDQVRCFKWLLQQPGIQLTKKDVQDCLNRKSQKCVKHLIRIRCRMLPSDLTSQLALFGCLDLFKLAVKKGYSIELNCVFHYLSNRTFSHLNLDDLWWREFLFSHRNTIRRFSEESNTFWRIGKFYEMIESKYKEIEYMKKVSEEVLKDKLPADVIRYHINVFF